LRKKYYITIGGTGVDLSKILGEGLGKDWAGKEDNIG